MIILLDRNESIELAHIALTELIHDPNKIDRMKEELFYKVDTTYEDLKLMVEIYLMEG